MTFYRLVVGFVLLVASAPWAQGPGTVVAQRLFSKGPLIPLENGDQLGRSVSALGDIDGDGICDLVAGAQGDDDGGLQGADSNVGAVWVLRLGPTGGLKAATKISATEGGFTAQLNDRDFFGKSVAGIGDLDGDGVPDMAVGSSRDDDGGTARGAVFLIFLNPDGSAKDYVKISSTSGGFEGDLKDLDEFGASVASLGDLDGDGVVDLIVGARLDDTGGTNRGAVYVLFLEENGSVRTHQKISSEEGGLVGPLRNDDSFGQEVTGIGDLDGDGVPDAVVAATKDDDGGYRKGAIYVLFLNRDGTVRHEQKISALAGGFVGPLLGNDEFGNGVSGLGDLDGDGVTDIAVGAIFDSETGLSKGAVWILFLNPDGTVKAEQKINEVQGGFTGELTEAGEFGEAVYTLGDLNGDGVAEIAVGERFRGVGGTGVGGLWILYLNGNPTDPALPDFSVSPQRGHAPLIATFTDTSSGDVRGWEWDFGDGYRSWVRDPQHTYQSPGRYSVTLTVTTPTASFSKTMTDQVAVLEPMAIHFDQAQDPRVDRIDSAGR